MKDVINRINAATMQIADIGLSKKMEKLPPDIDNDWRKAFSINFPKTKANTKGAGSYSNFLNRYPKIPKKSMRMISKMLLLML